jgi:hypothetical protein
VQDRRELRPARWVGEAGIARRSVIKHGGDLGWVGSDFRGALRDQGE